MAVSILALLEHPGQVTDMKNCLTNGGRYKLCVVDSLAKAKETLQNHSFDLIISDVHLENGGNVFDFLKWVKSQAHLQIVPFVLLSLQPTELAKYLADGVRTTARALGAAKYISMDSFDPVLLMEEITELLSSCINSNEERSKLRWPLKY